jgi:hypothetical protein
MICSTIDHGAEAALVHGVTRSPHWPLAEKRALKLSPVCAASGIKTCLQVHHIWPFHFCVLLGRPDLELDIYRNTINLSESEKGMKEVNYHLLIGHARNFQSSNVQVRADVKTFFGMDTLSIEANPIFQQRVSSREKPWDQWTDADKVAGRAALDTLYPLANGITPEMELATIIAGLKEHR